ncbi:MAG: TIGR04282 family arsenosugar biosynthesis glycosyltransferase [Pseudomonadota bacterium]
MPRRRLVVFVKQARPGRVKTRLAAEIGVIDAVWWYRHQTARLLRRLARDRRWQTVLAVAPDTAVGAKGWPGMPTGLTRQPQGPGDLGQRMARALTQWTCWGMGRETGLETSLGTGLGTRPRMARDARRGPVLVIGSDIPGITPQHLAQCFALLQGHDAVLGPADDGGYWAIGLRHGGKAAPAGLFKGVRWSSPHTLADTRTSMAGLTVALAATLNDVDTLADLHRLKAAQ